MQTERREDERVMRLEEEEEEEDEGATEEEQTNRSNYRSPGSDGVNFNWCPTHGAHGGSSCPGCP